MNRIGASLKYDVGSQLCLCQEPGDHVFSTNVKYWVCYSLFLSNTIVWLPLSLFDSHIHVEARICWFLCYLGCSMYKYFWKKNIQQTSKTNLKHAKTKQLSVKMEQNSYMYMHLFQTQHYTQTGVCSSCGSEFRHIKYHTQRVHIKFMK